MMIRTPLAAAIAVLLAAPAARAQTPLYLDLNTGFVGGFGTGAGTYNWADGLWTTSFNGTGSTGPWASNFAAFFGAGGTYTMSLGTSAFTVGGLIFSDANVTVGNGTSGTLALSAISTVTADVASGRTAIINAAISGGSGTTFSKSGTGLLALGGNNTFAGPLSIGAGTLQLGASNRIADTVAVTVAGGATFDLNDKAETVQAISGAGSIVLGADALTLIGAADSTFTGGISGNGALVKNGSGTLTLGGTNSFAGGMIVSGGTVVVGNSTTPGTSGSLANGIVLLSPGTHLIFARSNDVVFGGNITASGTGPGNLQNSARANSRSPEISPRAASASPRARSRSATARPTARCRPPRSMSAIRSSSIPPRP